MSNQPNHEELQQRIHELELKVRSLAMAQEVAQIGSWEWNVIDNTLTWSDETFRQFGFEPHELEPSYDIFSKFIHPDDLEKVNSRVQQAFDDDRPYSIEARMLRKDGSSWLMHAQGTIYRNANGKPERFVGTQRDITHLRHTEDELHLQAEIIDKLSEGICLVRESDGIILHTNPQFDAMFGYAKDEIVGKHVSIVNAPSDKSPEETAEEIMATLAKAGGRWQGEVHNVKKDGSMFWCLASISRLQHREHGSVSISVLTDITARKQDEEALRLQGEIMANMAEGVYLIRATDGIIVFNNEKFEQMFGYAPGEMIGKHVSIVNAPTNKSPEETAREIMADLKKKGSWQGEVYNIKKDGTPFWCQASVSSFNHPRHGEVLTSIHTDINERKRAEEALQKSEHRSRMILDKSMDGFFSSNKDGRFIDANEAYCNLIGYSRKQLQDMSISDIEALESSKEISQHIENIIRTGHERFESKHRHRDGHLVDIEISVTFDHSLGDLFFAFVRDISARKRTEAVLRENEERLRLIFESSVDAIYQINEEGNVTFMNRAGAEMFGYTQEEIKGRPFSLLVAENAIDHGNIALQRALAGENVQGEIIVKQRHGYQFPVSYSLAPLLKEESIVGVIGISSDITDRRKEEEKQLRESLAEKESLLKEIHHRVKNNMQ
ncbi:MAG: PAS domain S-box protein, partial [Desulfobulbaceae bacterium]|nr:PAS domain S-box protein [Desulfobulbaceae bacterium]